MSKEDNTWVGPLRDVYQTGDIKFMLENHNPGGSSFKYLRDTPALTLDTQEPKVYGDCGTNERGVNTQAKGVVRVINPLSNGRVLVRILRGAELNSALDSLGYPELK